MTRIKKWILTLVLITILVPITNVHAISYNAKNDVVISSQYYDTFLNYFGSDNEFRYFAYSCYTDRTCYYGIDSKNNYLNITFNYNGSYSYTTNILTGVDDNFNVSGLVYTHEKPYYNYYFTFIIIGLTLFTLIFMRCKYD